MKLRNTIFLCECRLKEIGILFASAVAHLYIWWECICIFNKFPLHLYGRCFSCYIHHCFRSIQWSDCCISEEFRIYYVCSSLKWCRQVILFIKIIHCNRNTTEWRWCRVSENLVAGTVKLNWKRWSKNQMQYSSWWESNALFHLVWII